MAKRLITILVPVFNEEQNIEPLYQALEPVLLELSDRYDFEILFTDNHSTDATFSVIERLAARDLRVARCVSHGISAFSVPSSPGTPTPTVMPPCKSIAIC